MIDSERPTRTVTLTDSQRASVRDKARADHEANGCDSDTRDPDNIMDGRIRGVGGELAFVLWARETFGSDAVNWVASDDGETEPYDVTVNGVRIDVQARNDANDYDSYGLLKARNLVQAKGDKVDAYVCMVTDSDARRFVLWGYAEAERLHNPQQIDNWRFDGPTHFMDGQSPYFKDGNELERRLTV